MSVSAFLWTLRLLAYPLLAYTVLSISMLRGKMDTRLRVLHISIGTLFMGLFVRSVAAFAYGYESVAFVVIRDYVMTFILIVSVVLSWLSVVRYQRHKVAKIEHIAGNGGIFNSKIPISDQGGV